MVLCAAFSSLLLAKEGMLFEDRQAALAWIRNIECVDLWLRHTLNPLSHRPGIFV